VLLQLGNNTYYAYKLTYIYANLTCILTYIFVVQTTDKNYKARTVGDKLIILVMQRTYFLL